MNQQPHDNWAAYYDFVYERTYGNFYKQFTVATINAIKDILKSKGTIFDYGAGTGRLAIPLAEHGYNVIGVEKSQSMADLLVQKAKKSDLIIEVNVGDIADFRNGKADLGIALFTVLNYSTSEEHLKNILSNIRNHLKIGGYFFFDLPQINFFQQRILANINEPDFKRRIILSPLTYDIHEYSEVCSGFFNDVEFNYADKFNIRYWDVEYVNRLLIKQGFKNINTSFNQFENTGSTYRLYQFMG